MGGYGSGSRERVGRARYMRTRLTISIATHVGVSGAINKARARELRRRDSSLCRGWKPSRPMGRFVPPRFRSLFRAETMTLALLLVPRLTTRVQA